ncbi:DNA repair protein [Algoriphagus kandeliae]|uniref:DNA repair protein n=1 Tax=Algoriphagus kandeliae TaxID=2562278 RepID=A0A4Y9QQM9_9BACT|nr:JAB domain-containing protein [Algoriphagus kandeliae]TFV93185.1 DNA repair protein [Algoriphagus kandeliae]
MKPHTLNEIKISYEPNRASFDNLTIKDSKRAYEYLYPLFSEDIISLQEEFIVLYLNRGNKILGYFKGFKGGNASVVCDIKIILSIALKGMASSIILAHNHPSGQLIPSEPDKVLTRKVRKACEALDLYLADHIIVAPEGGYFSFADEGLL